jgi:vacuolar-type H+-ATPase subunit H|tara:strand:- start:16 stop:318 length:303 start_codon:yes stop_codon:yes gene_type:complete
MDISEGKQTLKKIKDIETQIEAGLNQFRKEAKDIVSAAKAKAEGMVKQKEKDLAALRQSFTTFKDRKKTLPQNIDPVDIQTDHKLIQTLAKDLFKLLIKT